MLSPSFQRNNTGTFTNELHRLLTIFCVKHKSRQEARQDAVTAVAPEDTPTILEKRHDALKALEPVTEGIDPLAESTPSSQQPQATSGADLRTHSEISGEREW